MDAPFTFQLISLGAGGVAPCAQCARVADVPAASREPRKTEAVLAELAEIRQADVAFGGFEPFAHPDLPRLIAAARDRGACRLLLQTDGGALAQGGNAEGAAAAGVRVFEIVYHAGDEDADDTCTGRPGLARARREGIAALHRVAAQHPDWHLMICGRATLCRHAGRGAALTGIAQAAVRDGLDALRIQARDPGAVPAATQLDAAAEILTPSGIWLFGDACQSLLEGAAPYHLRQEVGGPAAAAPDPGLLPEPAPSGPLSSLEATS
ncbi:MAG: hypothetical protein FWC54_04605 [Actinomycetia bacterium]|nr:hypothetical protein [Actinomycetes bacterium]